MKNAKPHVILEHRGFFCLYRQRLIDFDINVYIKNTTGCVWKIKQRWVATHNQITAKIIIILTYNRLKC